MPRLRSVGFALLGLSLAVIAVTAPPGAASTFTWTQHPVAPDSGLTEPSISVRDDGHIVVCAPAGGNAFWASSDGGTTFTPSWVGGLGGDCEIEFLDDGTLVSSDLQITTSKVSISTDGGATWTAGGDAGSEQDRQWFAHRGSTLYNVYHSITHEYEFYVTSTDGGHTWSAPLPINSPEQLAGLPSESGLARPGDSPSPIDQGYNTFSGPMAIAPSGDLYVVWSLSDALTNVQSVHGFGPTRGVVVAHSANTGPAPLWTNRYAVVNSTPAPATGDVNAAIFPWITVDSAGTVYVLYNANTGGHFHTYYVYSTDKTATWSAPVRLDGNAFGAGSTVFVTGKAGAPGVLDVAWLESDAGANPDDGASAWRVEFAQVRSAASATPSISRSTVSDHIVHYGSICTNGLVCSLFGGDRSLGDFFELTLGPDGMAQLAWADNGGGPQRIWWAKQTSGPSAFTP